MSEIKILDQKVLENKKVILQTVKEIFNNGFEFTRKKIILPHITDDELLERYKNIKPIVSYEQAYYYLKKFNVDKMRNQSYIWNLEKDIRDLVDMTSAETIAEFTCYHTYGYPGLFKPSIAEVLQQFPDDILEESNAFYISSYPETANDLNLQSEILNAGCHQSTVKELKLKK